MQNRFAALAQILLFATFVLVPSSSFAQNRPNIVWISAEDLSPRLGAYGDELAATPNLDRLAAQGALYTLAFTTAGVCAPSRAAIITGMYQNSIGAHHMRTTHEGPGLPTPYFTVPPPYVKAFPEYLRAEGYFTTNNFKTDYQVGDPRTVWDEHSREAHWRSPNREPGQPFFSVFNFTVTHESQSWVAEDEELTTDPASVELPPYYPDTPLVRRHMAKHYDNIRRLDDQAGEILRQLEEDGLADNTIVFFWGDHGDGLPRAKRWLYDSGIRVPLIIRWPGEVDEGSTVDRLVSFVDLAPTVLSLAGVSVPAHMQGRVFLGPQAEEPREYVFGARDRLDSSYDMVRAARDKRFKYVRNYFPGKPYVLFLDYRNRGQIMQELFRLRETGGLQATQQIWMQDSRPVEELYDVEADPHEVRNLAGDPEYRTEVVRLRGVLNDWMEEIDDMGDVPEDRMVWQMWKGGEQPVTATPVFTERRSTSGDFEPSGTYDEPVEIVLYCGTHGASITYTTDEGDDARWKLYTAPLRLNRGEATVRARAIRYGYEESDEAVATFVVR